MKKLDLDVIEMVIAVAEAKSFVRGAAVVHRSASAVSMQIKSLEDALGKPLFKRNTRHVEVTAEGLALLEYGRKMLALRQEAWAMIVRPEVTGRIVLGVPDDYAPSLLPTTLRQFSLAHPRVEIQVIGRPSSELIPLLEDCTLDLACITRSPRISGEHIRFEPIVWAGSPSRAVWQERPLPLAVFEHGSVARERAIAALQRQDISFRMSYESPSLTGLVSMVEAGLAVAPLALCGLPERLRRLTQQDGLPDIGQVEIVLARSARSKRPPCDYLAEQILGGA
ncbi:LysR substrate-binding domain-containing protein [Aquitalea pelogenes]|uniref:LysR substrate-binding domain-containing protein n=1 Tax=Aquitalea pelogenes TaxID=1293573 RepID=UPI0007894B9F|nr:LysR substrate-binding domain-containing protein [Aquitalea pelogenes]